MDRKLTYLLSVLLLFNMGGAFHHHKEEPYNFSNDPTVYLNSHHCNDHANHPNLADNHYCIHCARITTSSTIDCEKLQVTNIILLDEVTPENTISFRSEDYLLFTEPRSPPYLARFFLKKYS